MGFFEPLDIPKQEQSEPVAEEEFVAPEWVGPPEGVVGGVVPFREVLYHDDRLAIWVDRVLAFPVGMMVFLKLHIPGRELDGKTVPGFFPWALAEEEDGHWGHPPPPTDHNDYFRFGIRYEDGRSAATATWDDDRVDYDRRSEDPPTGDELILLTRGGSGGGGSASVGLWIWPAPYNGPVDLLVAWPAAGVPELQFTISAEAITIGEADISTLWPVES